MNSKLKVSDKLKSWYLKNYRDFPWRKTDDPYKIWISEVMLQQTTSTAVIPFYEKFLERFPTIQSLSKSKIEDVYECWAGLGYYSRARNLHKAAVALAKTKFPESWKELIIYPGFGPYTARAVSSFAFDENVGVLDGNVIRFTSRYFGVKAEWWRPAGRNVLQEKSDLLVKNQSAKVLNQALIEIGSTICLSKNPKCLICPLSESCVAFKQRLTDQLPLQKQKRLSEYWIWTPKVFENGKAWGLVSNDYAPFLRGQLIWPGEAKKVKTPPSHFDFQHSITHHKIFIQVQTAKTSGQSKVKSALKEKIKWIKKEDLKKNAPASLISKVLEHY